MALYFFLQAIEALRPRKDQPQVRDDADQAPEEHPPGVRFYEDILGPTPGANATWRDLDIGQLNNELAMQAHALAPDQPGQVRGAEPALHGTEDPHAMAAGLVAAAGLTSVVGTAKAGKSGRKNAQVLGTPSRHATSDVREPSGIAFQRGPGPSLRGGRRG